MVLPTYVASFLLQKWIFKKIQFDEKYNASEIRHFSVSKFVLMGAESGTLIFGRFVLKKIVMLGM